MFEIGGLIVFCGLLAHKAAPLEVLSSALNETLPSLLKQTLPSPLNQTLPSPLNQTLHSPLNQTLPSPINQTLPSPLNQTLDGLLSEGLLGRLKKLPLSSTLKAEGVTSRAVFGGLLGKIATVIPFVNIIDVKITHPRLLDLDLLKSPDGSRFYVTIPLDMILNVNVPLVGSLLKGGVKLNITAELLTAQGEQKNIPLVLDSCTHPAGSQRGLCITPWLFPFRFPLIPFQRLFKSLSRILPGLVQGKVSGLSGSKRPLL
uniref:Lipid-binding serum glycoprotein N-terminal domain-containing protein n=1 Tax=Equus asinus TaxID=9793 RepID=A0A8C4LCD3_EQUAS